MDRVLRVLELILLFFLLPTVYAAGFWPWHPFLLMLPVVVWAVITLLLDPHFDRRQFWNAGVAGRQLPHIVLTFIAGAILLTAIVFIFTPHNFLNFVKHNPRMWALVMVLYPLVSVYPQEIVYRTFFFHRYQQLFPHKWGMIVGSAVMFSYSHIIFENAYALLLSLVGGLAFAYTFHRGRSTLAVVIEHGLFGCYIFTVGLGQFFYHGAVR